MEIRLARPSDLQSLRALAIHTAIDTFASANTPENMRAYIDEYFEPGRMDNEYREPGAMLWLGWADEDLVGFCRMRESDEAVPYLGYGSIELQRLYVHPDHQGKKIGSTLMQTAIDEAVFRRREWLWLGVWEHNYKAQEFYKKWGFEKFAEHVFPMGDDPQTDWMLKKRVLAAK